MLLLLLLDLMSEFRWELMYIFLTENIRSSLTHLHGFQLLVLLPWFIEIIFLICRKRINLLLLKKSSDRLVIVAKGLLKPLLPRNLAFAIFGELLIVFSTKVLLLYTSSIQQLGGVFAPDKAKLSAENSSKNSDLDDSS